MNVSFDRKKDIIKIVLLNEKHPNINEFIKWSRIESAENNLLEFELAGSIFWHV